MENPRLFSRSLAHAFGVLIYVSAVAWIMTNGDQLFGQVSETILGPISFLLLFVLSAAVVGLLVFAKPVMMYLDGMKKEAIVLLVYTLAWLALLTIAAIAIMLGLS